MEILELYSYRTDFRRIKVNAILCGWDIGKENNGTETSPKDIKYLDDLHCVDILISPQKTCRQIDRSGDFKRKLLCGRAKSYKNLTFLVIAEKITYLSKFLNIKL